MERPTDSQYERDIIPLLDNVILVVITFVSLVPSTGLLNCYEINPLNSICKYMYQMMQQPVTLQFVLMDLLWLLEETVIISSTLTTWSL